MMKYSMPTPTTTKITARNDGPVNRQNMNIFMSSKCTSTATVPLLSAVASHHLTDGARFPPEPFWRWWTRFDGWRIRWEPRFRRRRDASQFPCSRNLRLSSIPSGIREGRNRSRTARQPAASLPRDIICCTGYAHAQWMSCRHSRN